MNPMEARESKGKQEKQITTMLLSEMLLTRVTAMQSRRKW